jgi:hypothetical protein
VAFVELLVLHLENRVGEKIVTMIIRFRLQKCQQPPLTYLAELQDVFWKEVLGSPECLSPWKLPFRTESDGTIQIEPIQERNTVVCGMLNHRKYFATCYSGEGT